MQLPEQNSPSHRPPTLLALPSYLAGSVARLGNASLVAALKERDLRLPQFAVLVALFDFGPLAPHELATRLQADRSHISAYVEALVKREWVARIQDDADRRRVSVELTAEGRERVGELTAAAAASEQALLGSLAPEECDTLRELLTKVIVANETADLPGQAPAI